MTAREKKIKRGGGGRDYGTGRLSGSGGRRMDTGERAGRTGGAAGREGARHREREDGDDWKARDRWTVRQDGEDRWTDTEGRSWMGTKGRGEQTRDMIRGGSGRGKEAGGTRGGYGLLTLVRTGGRADVGAPGNVPATRALPPLPLPLCWLSGRGSPTKPKSQPLLPHLWGSSLPFCPWLGEAGGRGSCLPLPFSLAFSGHPLAAARGSPRSVSGHGVYSWESHPD